MTKLELFEKASRLKLIAKTTESYQGNFTMTTAHVDATLFKYLGGKAALGSTVPIEFDLGTIYAAGEPIDVVNVKAAAELLGIDTASVYRGVEAGKFEAVRFSPGVLMIFRASLPTVSDRPAVTVREAADRLGMTPARVHQLLAAGELRGYKVFSRKTQVYVESLEKFIDKRIAKYKR